MKIYISKYRDHWISPYRIAEKLCFWREISYDEPWVITCNKVLEPVMSIIMKILDTIHPRVDYIKIDKYDTWNMDNMLAKIILPMLKQLKATKHGYPSGLTEKKWDYILDEMIWTFEQLTASDANDDQFWLELGEIDWSHHEPDENGLSLAKWTKPSVVDWDGLEAHHKRINNGTKLFGKYYRNLWD